MWPDEVVEAGGFRWTDPITGETVDPVDSPHAVFIVGDRRFPTAKSRERDGDRDPQYIQHIGALVSCENGWQLSVIWGRSAYCGNYPHDDLYGPAPLSSSDAEVWCWSKITEEYYPPDDPEGWVTVDGFIKIFDHISHLPSGGGDRRIARERPRSR